MENYENAQGSVSVPKKDAKKYFIKIGLAVLLLPLVTNVLQYAVAFLVAAFAPDIYGAWWFSWLLSTVPLYCVAFPLFVRVLPKPEESIGEKRKFGAGKLTVACIIAISAMYVFNIVGVSFVDLINNISNGRLGNTDALTTMVNESPMWITLAIVCLVGPIMEEIIFRKVLIDRIVPFGELRACLVSALVFGLFHGNFLQFFYAAAIGFIFSYVYVKTRNIFYSIGMHIGLNVLGSVVVPNLLSGENLAVLERIAADPASMTNADAITLLLVMGTEIIGGGLIIAGIVLFFVFLRKIKFDAPKYEVEGGNATKMLFLNSAMIASMLIMAVNFVLSLL